MCIYFISIVWHPISTRLSEKLNIVSSKLPSTFADQDVAQISPALGKVRQFSFENEYSLQWVLLSMLAFDRLVLRLCMPSDIEMRQYTVS